MKPKDKKKQEKHWLYWEGFNFHLGKGYGVLKTGFLFSCRNLRIGFLMIQSRKKSEIGNSYFLLKNNNKNTDKSEMKFSETTANRVAHSDSVNESRMIWHSLVSFAYVISLLFHDMHVGMRNQKPQKRGMKWWRNKENEKVEHLFSHFLSPILYLCILVFPSKTMYP